MTHAEECMQREYMGEAQAYDDVIRRINEGLPIGDLYAYCKEKSDRSWRRADFMSTYGLDEEDKDELT